MQENADSVNNYKTENTNQYHILTLNIIMYILCNLQLIVIKCLNFNSSLLNTSLQQI